MSETPRMFPPDLRRQLLRHRVLVLDGPLDDENGTVLTTHLLTLAAENSSADIALWIHSPGGSVPAMLAIRDVMRLVPCDVSNWPAAQASFCCPRALGGSAMPCRILGF